MSEGLGLTAKVRCHDEVLARNERARLLLIELARKSCELEFGAGKDGRYLLGQRFWAVEEKAKAAFKKLARWYIAVEILCWRTPPTKLALNHLQQFDREVSGLRRSFRDVDLAPWIPIAKKNWMFVLDLDALSVIADEVMLEFPDEVHSLRVLWTLEVPEGCLSSTDAPNHSR